MPVANRPTSEETKESDGSRYTAPSGSVLVGRSHQGGESGYTTYHYATLVVVTSEGVHATTVGNRSWSDRIKESNSTYVASTDRVLTGRCHTGDENGYTEYQSAEVSVSIDGTTHRLSLTAGEWDSAVKETNHDNRAPKARYS
ncbi:hypothetical protein ACFV94_02560 [Streptomyces sp. NPDC059896]|uniref:hypothetical protein n=1 Tax=Streptomyces sp. NPDC059896 TaxID=3346993 RepID=UPI0036515889